jgi:anti-sigma factor ChrR (cupin superfamily)
LDFLPGTELMPLAEPVPEGSYHLAHLRAGTVIPPHTHPADEYVYVIRGTVLTGDNTCAAGTFWYTPGGVRQGPHQALTDVLLLTVRLGAMGPFET